MGAVKQRRRNGVEGQLETRRAPGALRVLQAFDTCGGRGVVIGRAPEDAAPGEHVELALASLLGEREANGEQATTVVLRLHGRDDAAWVANAMPWLLERGRRVVLRTPTVLPRSLAAAARERGVTVFLEIASADPEIQRALLGDGADSAASLLLHAQHLRTLGVERSVLLGPLLPVLHDPSSLQPLLRHIAAADIRDARLCVGRLSAARLQALERVIPWAKASAIARAFAVAGAGDRLAANAVRLQRHTETTLYHAVRRVAEATGIRIDHCGCPVHCHLAQPKPHPYRPLLTSDLFQSA
jgi:hypothetical protein